MAKSQHAERGNPQINDLIFKELIKRGYSLEGKTRVWNIADSKLWYLTPEQAKAFIELETKDEKQKMFVKKEIDLIKENFNELILDIENKNLNIIDLGCGDGKKSFAFVNSFQDKSKIRYLPIDINEFMISLAFENLQKIKGLNIIKLKSNALDFLDFKKIEESLRDKNFKTNYLLLLGGNLENSDAHELLYELKRSMKEGDILLIGNKLTHPNPQKMVEYYNGCKEIDGLLIKTISQLNIPREKVAYGARFHGNRIEMYYSFREDVSLESGGKKIDFFKGDKIVVTISYKYTENSLRDLLFMYFSDIEIIKSNDGTYALAVCKK